MTNRLGAQFDRTIAALGVFADSARAAADALRSFRRAARPKSKSRRKW